MEAEEALKYLLKKPLVERCSNNNEDAKYELEIKSIGGKRRYLASIYIYGRDVSFVLPAPWTMVWDAEGLLASHILKDIHALMGLKEDLDDGLGVFKVKSTPKNLDDGYKLANNYHRVMEDPSFNGLVRRLEEIDLRKGSKKAVFRLVAT